MSTKDDLRRTRLAYDYRVVEAMGRSSPLIDVRAFASQHDLQTRQRQISSASQGENAGYYLVHYHVQSLVEPGEFYTGFDVAFDLLSKKKYPEEGASHAIDAGGIAAACVSRPIAWSPHFLGSSGTICLGSIWKGARHTLLAHVFIHVARLLNWDEPIEEHYGGWNPAAVAWWKENLDARPITPELCYPVLPAELTHGLPGDSSSVARSVFVAKQPSRGFQIVKVVKSPAAPSEFKFRPNGILNI